MIGTARRRAATLALIVALGAASGCGDDDESTATQESTPAPAPAATESATAAPAGGEELALAATEDGGLGWDPKELSGKAGSVTINMENPTGNQFPHAVSLEGNGADGSGEVVDAGATSTVTADLEAGEYTYFCPVGQHRQQGMEGTLTVE